MHIREPRPRTPALRILATRTSDLVGKQIVLDASKSPISLGRRAGNDIVIPDDTVSRFHCSLEHRPDGWWLVDQTSTCGTHLNDARVTEFPLCYEDQISVGTVRLKFVDASSAEVAFIGNVYTFTVRDGLTRLFNRRAFKEHGERVLQRGGASLILLDLDHFKRLNDTHGHLVGDQVLQEVAQALELANPDGHVARYSGEEFVVTLAGVPLAQAKARAQALCDQVRRMRFPSGQGAVQVTISAGVAEARAGEALDDLLRAADHRLCEAKRGGYNRVAG